jgi:hypothetical protein
MSLVFVSWWTTILKALYFALFVFLVLPYSVTGGTKILTDLQEVRVSRLHPYGGPIHKVSKYNAPEEESWSRDCGASCKSYVDTSAAPSVAPLADEKSEHQVPREYIYSHVVFMQVPDQIEYPTG